MFRLIAKIKKRFEIRKYNDFTIAEYFRKQGAHIGNNNRILVQTLGPEPFLVKIGNHCTIAPHVVFLTHDGGTWLFTDEIPDLQRFGPIEIKDNCFIGLGAILILNVTIGPNSIVGAGSVVTKDVPPNTIVAGNPARIISEIDSYKKKVIEHWKYQKPVGYFQGVSMTGSYSPEQIQNLKCRDFGLLRANLLKLFNDK